MAAVDAPSTIAGLVKLSVQKAHGPNCDSSRLHEQIAAVTSVVEDIEQQALEAQALLVPGVQRDFSDMITSLSSIYYTSDFEPTMKSLTELNAVDNHISDLHQDIVSHFVNMLQLTVDNMPVWSPTYGESDTPSRVMNSFRMSCYTALRKISYKRQIAPSVLLIYDLERPGAALCRARGAFAEVYQGEWLGESVAIKVVTKPVRQGETAEEGKKKTWLRELVVWRQLQHANILPLLGIRYWEETSPHEVAAMCIVSPWAAYGTLSEYLRVPEGQACDRLSILTKVADALCYLHAHDPEMVHGDLHPANIVIDHDQQPLVTDFGLSQFYRSFTTSAISSEKGYEQYRAPEVWESDNGFNPTSAADMYAFGCLCYEVYSGRRPWGDKKGLSIYHELLSRRPPRSRKISDNIWDIIKSCWKRNVADRTRAKDVWIQMRDLQGMSSG